MAVRFLLNRTFNVRIGSTISDSYNIGTGVLQGAILSPLLLSDPPSVKNVHSLFYADDLSLFSISDNISAAVHQLTASCHK